MDRARKITDELLEETEKHLNEIYFDAYEGISKKWNAYMKSHAPKVEKALTELQEALESNDRDRIAKAKEHYAHTVRNVTVNDERFRAMRDEVVKKIGRINEVALDYVNDEMPKVYTVNYNAFGTQKVAGYSFALVSEEAVKELAMSDDLLLPKKKVDIPKDEAWNKKNINSQILQGILQGESIPKMAKRLMNVTDMNRKSAIRNARTMTTAAENKGRQDSFKKAQDDGVIMEREWLSAHDGRTRDWHLKLHGVKVAVDEPWENDFGKIMYPGDPTADAANVYNCRCGIRAHVKGFKWSKQEKGLDTTLPTLINYDEAYTEFKQKRSKQIDNAATFDEMNAILTDLVKNNDFRLRVPTDDASVLKSIISDGKFKTQFETNSSGGLFAPDKRKQASHNLFGTGDIADSQYEKYGYLGTKDLTKDYNPQLGFYGDGIVTFKKSTMMNRTTLTVGDSLRDAADGRYIMGTSVNDIDSTVAVGRPSMADELLDRMNKGIKKDGLSSASQIGYVTRSYIELQFHGDLTLDDIDSITVDKHILDEVFSNAALKKKVKDAKIKCNYIMGNDIISYNLD